MVPGNVPLGEGLPYVQQLMKIGRMDRTESMQTGISFPMRAGAILDFTLSTAFDTPEDLKIARALQRLRNGVSGVPDEAMHRCQQKSGPVIRIMIYWVLHRVPLCD